MLIFLKNTLELFGVVYLRFRVVPRVWCIWLVAVNAACLLYIDRIEAQVVLAVTGVAVVMQTFIYQNIGFTRILGSVHYMWVPMFVWMTTRLDTILADPGYAIWLAILFATNFISLIIDTIDATRFIRGERAPHYYWEKGTVA